MRHALTMMVGLLCGWAGIAGAQAVGQQRLVRDLSTGRARQSYLLLAEIGAPTLPSLRRATRSSDAVVRYWAVAAIGRIGNRKSVPLLRRMLPDDNCYVAEYGSFYHKGNRLYAWNLCEQDHGHAVPHRCQLKESRWTGTKYHIVRVRQTRRYYAQYYHMDRPAPTLNPRQDPLQEFGLSWHWWTYNSAPYRLRTVSPSE